MISFVLNGEPVTATSPPDTPLLWVLREELKLPGTKYGCGIGHCGACTTIVDGCAVRSCLLPLSSLEGKAVLTIEGLGGDHPVQQAWIEGNVPQCGYCQSGQIMTTVAFLTRNPSPSREDARSALSGNICRCGAYQGILDAVETAAINMKESDQTALFYEAGACPEMTF